MKNDFLKNNDFIFILETAKKFHQTHSNVFDAFAKTQYISKIWLILKLLNYIDLNQKHKIYVFGGWYGFLPFLLFNADDIKIDKIYNIDTNKNCEEISNYLNKNNKNYIFVNQDMKDWNKYDSNPIVINTSFEHINDETYQLWYDKIPKDSLIILQSNNLFRIKEHIRCCNDLKEFEKQSLMTNILWKGETYVDQYKEYKRFMIIGKKI